MNEPLGFSSDATVALHRTWHLRADVRLVPPDIRELGGMEIVARSDDEQDVIAVFLAVLCGEQGRRPSKAVREQLRTAPLPHLDGDYQSAEVYRRWDRINCVGTRLVLTHESATPPHRSDWAAMLVHWGVDRESNTLYVLRVSRAAPDAESARKQVLDAAEWMATIDHGSLSNTLLRRDWEHLLSLSGGQLYGGEPRFARVTIEHHPHGPKPPPVRTAAQP